MSKLQLISEVIGNLSGGILSLCSIIILLIGIRVSRLYKERRFEAIYGLYSNLEICCEELTTTINTNIAYWNKCDEKKQKSEGDKSYENDIKKQVNYIIDIFKSEKNQIPLEDDCENWKKNIKEFHKKLFKLRYLGEIDYINEYENFIKSFLIDLKYVSDAIYNKKPNKVT